MKKVNWNNLSQEEQSNLLKRPARTTLDSDFKNKVKQIINEVKSKKDEALFELTSKYDHVQLKEIKVSQQEWAEASQQVSEELIDAIQFAIQNIETYHRSQLPKSLHVETRKGVLCERQARPIQRVGLYVPGGSAPLLSTALMLAVPARLAQCKQIVVCSPPDEKGKIHPALLMACQLSGIQEVYKVGGAQAIAAMAYGTQTIPSVDKIFGPGNSFVTQAKLWVSEDPYGAAMDLPAGPSELFVIANDTANPHFVAADLLSQAEHGMDSQVFLASPSPLLLEKVETALQEQIPLLSRQGIIKSSLDKGALIQVNRLEQAIKISNQYAPEHLILAMDEAEKLIPSIDAAGAIFVGHFTPETAGDYVTGSNHVLPTYGYARNYSGLSIHDFMKYISIQTLTQEGLKHIGTAAQILAEVEGLTAHKNAITLRLREII